MKTETLEKDYDQEIMFKQIKIEKHIDNLCSYIISFCIRERERICRDIKNTKKHDPDEKEQIEEYTEKTLADLTETRIKFERIREELSSGNGITVAKSLEIVQEAVSAILD